MKNIFCIILFFVTTFLYTQEHCTNSSLLQSINKDTIQRAEADLECLKMKQLLKSGLIECNLYEHDFKHNYKESHDKTDSKTQEEVELNLDDYFVLIDGVERALCDVTRSEVLKISVLDGKKSGHHIPRARPKHIVLIETFDGRKKSWFARIWNKILKIK